jgi:glycosyltransferase involved in cell wall biosynthesis
MAPVVQLDEGRSRMTSPARVAYVVRRFPKVSETFVLNEIVAVSRAGVPIDLYALRRGDPAGVPDAAPFLDRLHVWPFLSADILRANARYWRHAPDTYAQALRDLLRGTWGSRRYFRSAFRFFLRSVRMAAEMSARGVTHVHAHFAASPTACAFVIHRLTGIPYSFTAHGSDIHRDRTMLLEKVAEARFVVAVSRFNRDVILEACRGRFGDKVVVIHCGVDPNRFRPAAREAPDGPTRGPGPFRVVCVGRLHGVKGQGVLLEACRLLAARGIAVECHLVGDGPDRTALEARARVSGLDGRVHFHGWQTPAEVATLLRAADVAATPSVPSPEGRLEGIPVALMEAMATGVPVVASRLAGIPELVDDGVTGLLTPPGDPVALAGALERLWRDPAERARFGRAGRRRVQQEFDLWANAAALASRFRDPSDAPGHA